MNTNLKFTAMNEMLLRVIDNMHIQSKTQFERLRELLEISSPEIIDELDHIVDKFNSKKTYNEILYQCCEEVFGVSPDELHERTRKRSVVDARGMFITFLFFSDDNMSLQKIGKQFDLLHSTCIHAIRKFCELYVIDGEWRFHADEFFDTLEKYGYNCKETKQLLKYGQPYFNLKGTVTRRKDSKTGATPSNKIERLSFHCAIT